MKYIYLTFWAIFISPFLFSQFAPEIEWQNTIGGFENDFSSILISTNDGGNIIGGYTFSGIGGDKTEENISDFSYDFWIVKVNESGDIQWQNTIGGNGSDVPYAIEKLGGGGYLIGGSSSSGISGDKTEPEHNGDFWFVKINEFGEVEWDETIGGDKADHLKAIKQTNDGGIILGGISYSGISFDKTEESKGKYDYWLIKLNSDFSLCWQKAIGGSKNDNLRCLQQTADCGYILGGYSDSDISGDKSENNFGSSFTTDYWIVKTDSIGTIEWERTLGGTNSEVLISVNQTADHGYILGGYSDSDISGNKTENSKGAQDIWLVKLDSTGVIEWQKTIGGDETDYLNELQINPDGGYLLAGTSYSGISGDKTEDNLGYVGSSDIWILKIDSYGNILWQNVIGGDNVDYSNSTTMSNDGGIVVFGTSNSEISDDKAEGTIGNYDYWIIKLLPENPPCSTAPTGLYADFLTSSTAKLHWTADPDAIKYKVQYRKSTVLSWTNTNATSNVKNLFSLEPSTTYKFRVKTNCGAGVLSDWSNVATFTTLPLREGEFISDEQINIYPNPANNIITVETNLSAEKTIYVTDALGKIMQTIHTTENMITINVSNLSAGIYFIKMEDGINSVTQNFIKQ